MSKLGSPLRLTIGMTKEGVGGWVSAERKVPADDFKKQSCKMKIFHDCVIITSIQVEVINV